MARTAHKREIKFSNPNKQLFPDGTTKSEMIRYYVEVAPFMLPHLRDRPVTLIRYPDGVKAGSFYEKNAPKFRPAWVDTFQVPRREDRGFINYILINQVETLAWCANLAAIELHPFLHRVPRLNRPTHVAFDLDPGEGADIFTCARVALRLRALFDQLQLESFPKVSGSKGIQIYVPLNTAVTYDITSAFAKTVALLLAKEHPDQIVSVMSKALRRDRVMIDWSQNSRSKTTVSVYSMRGKRDEPFISLPLTWQELERATKKRDRAALDFTPDEALARLRKIGDLFAPVLTLKQKLPREFLQAVASPPEESLRRYAKKRDFTRTREPAPAARSRTKAGAGGAAPRFVIQKHAATQLHYDFRLELHGTLKSWAVPKGVPYEPGIKRAAFEVEDHPLDYIDFEGTIPKGQYGGGTVMVWDTGSFDLLGGNWHKGDLKLQLHGRKLKGEWHIFRIKRDEAKPVWLLVKSGSAVKAISAKRDDTSVLTGRSMARIAADNDAQWQSGRAEKSTSAKHPRRAAKPARRRKSKSPPRPRARRSAVPRKPKRANPPRSSSG